MCGIVGFIGRPRDRKACFDLTTSLLVKTELRGDDASGYWACNTEDDSDKAAIFFSKAPQKSSHFVNTDPWQELKDKDLNLLVSHCRKSSTKGSENRNKNNHPFIGKDYRTALVHNGNVPEFDVLKDEYDIMSDCDSEILLRMMERGDRYPSEFLREQLGDVKGTGNKKIKDCNDEEIPEWSHKLLGLMDIFARINYGAMAVAIAEKLADDTRALWLFRDKDRPLHVVDMRKTLGQIYVVSEKRIWRSAVENTPGLGKYVEGSTPIIEFPAMCIWLLTYNTKGEFDVRKFKVNRQRRHDTTFGEERPDNLTEAAIRSDIRVITNLNSSHEVVAEPSITTPIRSTPLLPAPKNKPMVPSSSPPRSKNRQDNDPGLPILPTVPSLESLTAVLDWPEDCFEYMLKHIALSSNILEGPKPIMPGPVSDLKDAAKDAKVPDSSLAWQAKTISRNRYIDWAQTLQDKYKWVCRYRTTRAADGDCTSKPMLLTDLLQEAHEAWAAFVENKRSNFDNVDLNQLIDISDWPRGCHDFMAKAISVISRPSRQWNDKCRIVNILADDLRRAAIESPICDSAILTAKLGDSDYKVWADRLQHKFGWCDRTVNGSHETLSTILRDGRDTWIAYRETKQEDDDGKVAFGRPDSDNNRTAAAQSHVDLTEGTDVPFGPDPPTRAPLSYENVRTDEMSVTEKGSVDQVAVDNFHDRIRRIRAAVDEIEKTAGTLLREDTMNSHEFDQILDSLNDVASQLETDRFFVEKACESAST